MQVTPNPEPHPAPEAHLGSVPSPAQAANPGDSGQTPRGGGGWPWAAPEPLSSPCSRQSSPDPAWMGLLPMPGIPSFSCCSSNGLEIGPQPTAFCRLAYSTVPLAASPAAPLAPGWEPSRQRWHRGCGSSKGLAAQASSRGATVFSTACLSGVSLGPPLCPRHRGLKSTWREFKYRGGDEMYVRMYRWTNQWRYVRVQLKQTWRNQAPNLQKLKKYLWDLQLSTWLVWQTSLSLRQLNFSLLIMLHQSLSVLCICYFCSSNHSAAVQRGT